jgi:Ca2+-binding RTX toxin-like protein
LVYLDLGDRDDTVRTNTARTSVVVEGGPGRDQVDAGRSGTEIRGGPGEDQLLGGAGHDVLDGGPGNDVLRGGRGDDRLDGGLGTDDVGGGRGDDVVHYGYPTDRSRARVTVTLDGRANDGTSNERDRVRADVENVTIAARAGSAIVGNGGPNELTLLDGRHQFDIGRGTVAGGAGEDTISGPGRLLGGEGSDTIAGAGRVFGGPGEDRIDSQGPGVFDGGPGSDLLRKSLRVGPPPGRRWSARFVGGPGNDEIEAADGFCRENLEGPCTFVSAPIRDTVACGAGRDRAELDTRDVVLGGCERRRVRR